MGRVIFLEEANFEKSVEDTFKTLQMGGVVIIPTDTIYGFSSLQISSEKIRDIKKRDDKPFIYLISDINQLSSLNVDKNQYLAILEKNWPASITFLMKNIREEKIGARLPKNNFIKKIIDKLNEAIVSTSVNYSGEKLINAPDEIIKEFGDKTDLIVIDKNFRGDKASTIVDISSKEHKIIREGSVVFKCP